jgi:uncharacterized protein (TIGR02646 family)
MIRYPKGVSPKRLTDLAATPGMTWTGLGAHDRDPIRAALVRDQGGLCAYCQQTISLDEDPETGHNLMKIEHWIARSSSTEHHLIWSNLLGVCLGGSRGTAVSGDRNTRHCDDSRGNRPLFLHPVDGQGPDPREHLRYNKAGRVESVKADARVDADIEALNLNAPQLVRARKAVFDALWDRLKRHEFSTGELRKEERRHRIVSGTKAPAHLEFVRYHVRQEVAPAGRARTTLMRRDRWQRRMDHPLQGSWYARSR